MPDWLLLSRISEYQYTANCHMAAYLSLGARWYSPHELHAVEIQLQAREAVREVSIDNTTIVSGLLGPSGSQAGAEYQRVRGPLHRVEGAAGSAGAVGSAGAGWASVHAVPGRQ